MSNKKPISYSSVKGGGILYPLFNTTGKFLYYATAKFIQRLKPLALMPGGGFIIKTKKEK